jgi:hypothetical protein
MSESIFGTSANEYNPVFEKYIGKKVIAEIREDDITKKYEGILKDYTGKYIELLNVHYDFLFEITGRALSDTLEYSQIQFAVKDNGAVLEINNDTPRDLQLVALRGKDFSKDLSVNIEPHQTVAFPILEYRTVTDFSLLFKTERKVDMICPVTHIRIIHGGLNEKMKMKEILGLDDISLSFIKKRANR